MSPAQEGVVGWCAETDGETVEETEGGGGCGGEGDEEEEDVVDMHWCGGGLELGWAGVEIEGGLDGGRGQDMKGYKRVRSFEERRERR